MSKKHENNCKRLPKWAEIDAKTHQKSMPELVSKKIREIIKNHVSLKSEIIEIHWKNNGFWWFRKLHVRTVKVSKKHQKWDQIPSEIQWKINTKNMLEKREPKYENSLKKWSKNGAKIHQKAFQNRCEKRDKNIKFKIEVGGRGGIPKPIISKDILRSEVRRKYTKKVEWGVSAEWSAKSEMQRESAKRQVQGECRKASADREPTTHSNTLGGSDHVRI